MVVMSSTVQPNQVFSVGAQNSGSEPRLFGHSSKNRRSVGHYVNTFSDKPRCRLASRRPLKPPMPPPPAPRPILLDSGTYKLEIPHVAPIRVFRSSHPPQHILHFTDPHHSWSNEGTGDFDILGNVTTSAPKQANDYRWPTPRSRLQGRRGGDSQPSSDSRLLTAVPLPIKAAAASSPPGR